MSFSTQENYALGWRGPISKRTFKIPIKLEWRDGSAQERGRDGLGGTAEEQEGF